MKEMKKQRNKANLTELILKPLLGKNWQDFVTWSLSKAYIFGEGRSDHFMDNNLPVWKVVNSCPQGRTLACLVRRLSYKKDKEALSYKKNKEALFFIFSEG